MGKKLPDIACSVVFHSNARLSQKNRNLPKCHPLGRFVPARLRRSATGSAASDAEAIEVWAFAVCPRDEPKVSTLGDTMALEQQFPVLQKRVLGLTTKSPNIKRPEVDTGPVVDNAPSNRRFQPEFLKQCFVVHHGLPYCCEVWLRGGLWRRSRSGRRG